MNGPTEFYQGNDNSLIGDELEKLFVFQDKHLSREKKAIFVEEIEKTRFPIAAVIQGIRSLVGEDLASVKLARIMSSIRSFMDSSQTVAETCRKCLDGVVVARDDRKYLFSLGCECARGAQRSVALGITRWNGEQSMMAKGRLLVLCQ